MARLKERKYSLILSFSSFFVCGIFFLFVKTKSLVAQVSKEDLKILTFSQFLTYQELQWQECATKPSLCWKYWNFYIQRKVFHCEIFILFLLTPHCPLCFFSQILLFPFLPSNGPSFCFQVTHILLPSLLSLCSLSFIFSSPSLPHSLTVIPLNYLDTQVTCQNYLFLAWASSNVPAREGVSLLRVALVNDAD